MSELKQGVAFNLPTPPNGEHYFFVVLGPSASGDLIIVNIDTIKDRVPFDSTTVLRPGRGMPRFIKKRTYVNYRRAKLVAVSELKKQIDAAPYTTYSDIDAALLSQLQQGLVSSGQTPRGIKKAAQTLLDPGG
mgnify:CR=1 FL=1